MQNTSVPASENPPKLLDQVRAKIRLKHYSIRTEQAYTDWIKRYILHFGKRHPRDMGVSEVTQFLTHLAVQGKVSASTQNQAKAALLFLYSDRTSNFGFLMPSPLPSPGGRGNRCAEI